MNADRYSGFKTPYYIVDEILLKKNLEILDSVQKKTGAKILLALKGFSMYSTFPLLRKTLAGICASSPDEARLGKLEFKGEVHSFAAAYSDNDFDDLLKLSDHIVFNSISQYEHFKSRILETEGKIKFGLRINPEHRETEVEMYDPCAPGSRLGITAANFPDTLPEYITGLHFHTLCEKNSDSLERTLAAVEYKFSHFLQKCEWINFGGGHHITRDDYDIELLCSLIERTRKKYNVQIYLEPGEAVALNAGFLVASVLDVISNDGKIAILDTSAAAHMPDVIEMPYRPNVIGSGKAGEKKFTYRLAGLSCLAGDVIGDYSFDEPLKTGDKLVFTDMAIYSMVKNNTFNGIRLPDIYFFNSENGKVLHKKTFSYEDFKMRLS
ncbi:MAG: carboxynorspermidine decarboxylase [Spirochaetes bacterium]|nr:carboxynorspermidine decarboxylase [Spirochaetota bacterium]